MIGSGTIGGGTIGGGLPPHIGNIATEIAAAIRAGGYTATGHVDGRGVTLVKPKDAPPGVAVALDEIVLLMVCGAVEAVLRGASGLEVPSPAAPATEPALPTV
jgi:hypothetical protein